MGPIGLNIWCAGSMILLAAGAAAQQPGNRAPSESQNPPNAAGVGSPVPPGYRVQQGFDGSIPTGDLAQNLDLSLTDALRRALKYNLALVQGTEQAAQTRAQRLRALSLLLPGLNIRPAISEQQVNLAAFGLRLPNVPSIVGPFHVWDLRGYGTEQFAWEGVQNWRASRESDRAARLSIRDARDQVVAIVVQLYLQAIAGSARIEAERAQVATAQTLFRQAADRRNAGTAPGIDVLRAQVELQAEEQRLIQFEGEFEKQKLALARAIGLPTGQQFRLAQTILYTPLEPGIDLNESLATAFRERSDYQAAEALVKSAELALSGARAARYPAAFVNADYGVNGLALDQLHGSFTILAGVNIPVFQAGRIRANREESGSRLREARAQRDDLRGRIDAEVRNAFTDLRSAGRQVEVANSNIDLARKQVTQSQDRFTAGVTNNVEVVQAQNALASANESYIAALYAFNAAKAALARARGDAEQSVIQFLNLK